MSGWQGLGGLLGMEGSLALAPCRPLKAVPNKTRVSGVLEEGKIEKIT